MKVKNGIFHEVILKYLRFGDNFEYFSTINFINYVTKLCLKKMTFYAPKLGQICEIINMIRGIYDYDFRRRV